MYATMTFSGESLSESLHGTSLSEARSEEDLVLVDAGGVGLSCFRIQSFTQGTQEYGGYIADITRTWPLSGTFSDAQKELYTAILSTQRSCISMCRASESISLDRLHEVAEASLKDSLSQLGFDMSGKVQCLWHLQPLHFQYLTADTPHS